MEIRSPPHHRENPRAWLRDKRNGGSGFDVRFARRIYRCVISQMARHLSRAARTLALCHITPGFVYPTRVFSLFPSYCRICCLFSARFYRPRPRFRREAPYYKFLAFSASHSSIIPNGQTTSRPPEFCKMFD